MGDVAAMTVGVRGNTEHYERSMSRAAYIAKLTAQQISSAFESKLNQIDEQAKKTSSGFEAMFTKIKGLAAGAAAALGLIGVGEVLRQADQYQQLESRIRSVTAVTGDFAKVNEELFSISQRNGVQFEATANTFQSLVRAGREFGATNDQVLKVTAAIQQLGVISGTSGESMKAAMLQFGQALASGRLQGDELRSIMENMPELASRLAEGLGVARGSLKALGAEGKLTSDVVFNALLKQTEEINAEFAKMPLSMERAFTAAQNSITRFLGEADQLTGITRIIARNIQSWSQWLDSATTRMKNFGQEMVGGVKRASLIQATLEQVGKTFSQPSTPSQLMFPLLKAAPLFTENFGKQVQERAKQIEAENKALDQQAHKKAALATLEEASGKKKKTTAEELARLEKQIQERAALGPFYDFEKADKDLTEKIHKENAEAVENMTRKIVEQHDVEKASMDLQQRRLEHSNKVISTMRRELEQQQLINQGKEREAEWLRVVEQLKENSNAKTPEQIENARKIFDQQTAQLELTKRQAKLQDEAQAALQAHMDKSKQLAESLGSALSNAFENAVINGHGFGSVLKSLAVDLERMILRLTVLQPLQNAILNAATGGVGSGVFSFIGNLFRGGQGGGPAPLAGPIHGALPVPVVKGFAGGGNFGADEVIAVGEQGPELIKPRSSGTVIPNRALSGIANPEVNVYVVSNGEGKPKVDQRENGKGGRDIIVEFIEQAAQDVQKGGRLGRSIQQVYGLNRSTTLR